MTLDSIVGTYTEDGVWKDSTGANGSLSGLVTVRHDVGKIEFSYEDGTHQISEPIGEQDQPIELHGTLGDGKLFLAESSFTLEYEADVGGRIEYNTDTWIKSDKGFHRAGVIRQNDRTIWFEAEMRKSNAGV